MQALPPPTKTPKKARNKQLELLNALRRPVGFAKILLGMKLYPWQEKVLRDLEQPQSRVALRAANGSGKTGVSEITKKLSSEPLFLSN